MFHFYFYDHITSYLTLIIQVLAFGYAISEYWRWKNKASNESEHKNLLELFELVTNLKNGLHRFEDSFSSSIKFEKVFDDRNSIQDFYKLHTQLHDLYDNLIADSLVLTETKSDIIKEIFNLKNVDNEVQELIKYAKSKKATISDVVDALQESKSDYPKLMDSNKIDLLYKNIRLEIKNSSKILNSKL